MTVLAFASAASSGAHEVHRNPRHDAAIRQKNTPAARHGGLDDRRMNQPGGMEAKRCHLDNAAGSDEGAGRVGQIAATEAQGRRSEARTETAP